MSKPIPEGKYLSLSDNMTLHYHEAGEGIPVVFVHGSGPGASGWSNFNGNYPRFAEAGFRAIVPDLPGYGYSSKPKDARYTLDFMAANLKAFVDKLELKQYILVGNSLGGAICIRMALNHPEEVAKLILMAPGGLEEREVYMNMKGIKTMVRSFFAEEGVTREGMRETFKLQLFNPELITDEIIEQRYQIALTQPKTVISTMKVPNQSPLLRDLSCPILGFWGTDDQFCPSSGAMTVANNCSNVKMILLSECGHWVMVEHKETFNRACLEFLSE